MFQAKVILDSVGIRRLTTMELTYPRFVHSEFMTHRMFSRNAASSRAIPIDKMLKRIEVNPVLPVSWGKNQKGMQAEQELDEETRLQAQAVWLKARDSALTYARELEALGVHKQLVNRITEPWMYITVIVTATEWSNFFSLRCHKDAQPEIAKIAYMARDAYESSVPTEREWHLPYIQEEELTEIKNLLSLIKMSVARCARVSMLNHDGKINIEKDFELYDRLLGGSGFGHWSPFEHVASRMYSHLIKDEVTALIDKKGPSLEWALSTNLLIPEDGGYVLTSFGRRLVDDIRSGNFFGWTQHRKKHVRECM